MLLFLAIAGAAGAVLVSSMVHTSKVKSLTEAVSKKTHLHTAISMLLVTAQVSELTRVVEHTTLVNVVAALFLCVILVATKAGTEARE